MINIINPDYKRQIRTARVNVLLLRYAVMLASLAILVAVIYGIGFWLVGNEKRAVEGKLASQSAESQAYDTVKKEAESFRENLTIAKTILDKEISYSTFLTTLASDLPSGAILVNLSIGGPASRTGGAQAGLTIDARTSSYAKVLELKDRLEKSDLFENVSIVSASRPNDISNLTGQEARYPYEASFNVRLSVKNPTGVAR